MTSKLQYCRDLGYDTDSSYKLECPTILIDDLECNKYIDFEAELQNVGCKDGNMRLSLFTLSPQMVSLTLLLSKSLDLRGSL